MSRSLDKSTAKSGLSVQTIVFAEILWAVLALLFFLLFSVPDAGQERSPGYSLGTSIFEAVAYFSAAWLCLRNWRSPQIVSGRNVWLGIGLGTLCYGLGGLLFGYWETGLQRDAAVSPGDFFFVLTYLFLVWGMGLAVGSRRLNLEGWQWGVLGGIAILSTIFALLISFPPGVAPKADLSLMAPANAQSAPAAPAATPKATTPPVKASPKAAPALQAAPPKPPVTPIAPVIQPSASPVAPAKVKPPDAPAWVKAIEESLKPLEKPLGLFYLIADVVLLIIATTLLLAFWGGRFSQSWKMIAAAAFSLYIADMWFKYANSPLYPGKYQSGDLLEVFWVFSGVLFGIGAALEFDLSRSRRTGSRRRA
jgi:hypothetical protein